MPDPKAGGTREVRRADNQLPVELDIRPLINRGAANRPPPYAGAATRR